MLSQDTHEKQRYALMEAAVKAAVEGGLTSITARKIGALSGVNEVYIYRYFSNKNDLISKTFEFADERILGFILDNFDVMNYADENYIDRCRELFSRCWDFIMLRPDWLVFYVRYYYSSTFQKLSYDAHMRRYAVLIDKMRPACHPGAEVATVLHHILDTTLGQARKQIMHPQEPETAKDNAFWLVFSVLKCGKGI